MVINSKSPPAPAPAHSDRRSQLEKQIIEIREVTLRDVLEELRRLSYEIKEVSRRVVRCDNLYRAVRENHGTTMIL